jgi:hypothetical protein
VHTELVFVEFFDLELFAVVGQFLGFIRILVFNFRLFVKWKIL